MMPEFYNVAVVGSGMGALSAAGLLARDGLRVLVLEQNYLPGGCVSSYWRKGFVFESGATTLVGLDKGMPLRYLLDELGIEIQPIELEIPMKVYLRNGVLVHKYRNLDLWIEEAERVFGIKNQRKFWKLCFKISEFVWQTSLKQKAFPPTRFSDLMNCILQTDFRQLSYASYSFYSMEWLLKKFDLWENSDFREFVDEQLLITAQNYASEVNVLFGATALCYTNYGNYYMPGGLINLVNPLLEYLQKKGSEIRLREEVKKISYEESCYLRQKPCYFIESSKNRYCTDFLISGLPINNTIQIYQNNYLKEKYTPQLLHSKHLNSAFQIGIGFKIAGNQKFDCIHHQIHLKEPVPEIDSKSIFVSLNHPDDKSRCDFENQAVASISTHIADPENRIISDKKKIEEVIIQTLEDKGILKKENIIYRHSSAQKSWKKWTGREYGFVGGYPQYRHIKPWQMLDARLDGKKAYICGDTVYPGQGIPGTVLSGIIAYYKLKRDWKRN